MSPLLLALAAFPLLSFSALELRIVDARSGRTIPARVLIQDSLNHYYLPPDAVPVPIGPERWFASAGEVHVDPGAKTVTVRVERGPEYKIFRGTIDGASKQTIGLERWIDMRARGYASGENHLHVDIKDLGAMLTAEDLNFGNSLYWWNGPKLTLPAGPEPIRVLTFAGRNTPSTVFDAEVEYSWGAVYLIGLRKPMAIVPDRPRSNVGFVQEARRERALIAYQGGYSREVLLDALNGNVDVVNVCNNNFHRYKFQPRPQYSNLLGVGGLPTYPPTAEGMMQLNTDSYYRLLNCGLRLAAGAESATGAKSTPAGYNRAYVRAGTRPALAEFLEAWRGGRNFVTNGPMIFLTANGQEPGDTIKLPAGGGKVDIRAAAMCDQPLRSLDIVVNGRVVAHGSTGDVRATIEVREGSWIAARATAEDRTLSDAELDRFKSGSKQGGEEPTRVRFGHTSPIYCTVAGAGPRVAASLIEARKILDAFERYARATAGPKYLQEILDTLPRARQLLE
jgi:hypothetical protein